MIGTTQIGNGTAITSENLATYGIETTGDVVIPEYVTDDDNTRHAVTSIGDYAFRDCNEMTSVTIADSVTEIGTGAFVNCSKLSSVSMPAAIRTLGNSVFDGCDSLATVSYNGNEYNTSEIESAMTENGVSVGTGAFEHTYSEPVYTWSEDNSTCTATRICSECSKKETESATTTNGITKQATCTNTGTLTYTALFKNKAFKTQTADEVIPVNGVHVFDNGVCTECGLFTAWSESGINVATNYTDANYATAATSPAYLFTNKYPNTKIISIPSGVTNIGDYAFVGCANLTNITIPNTVTLIGNASFSGCSGIKQLTLSSNTKTIKDWAFANCTSMTELVIPNSVTTIGGAGFYNCSNVNYITLSNNITSIGNQAFINNYALTSVTYKGVTYTSKSALQSALKANRVSVGYNVFDNTSLQQ